MLVDLMTTTSARSLATSRLVAFVATTNADNAKEFYADLLGLTLESEDDYALVFDANGTMLRIQKTESVTPPAYTVLGWHVDDIARLATSLAEQGVQFERFAGLEQDDLGIWTTPGGSRVAWFKDPDGNILSLTQFVR